MSDKEVEIEEVKQETKQEEQIIKANNLKKLISWGGWKKELGWTIFFILLLFAAYSYKRDIDMCRPYIIDPCSKCSERDTATIVSLQSQIDAINEMNKIDINYIGDSFIKDD